MKNLIILLLSILIISCTQRMDLAKLELNKDKISNYLDEIEVKEKQSVDLAKDFKFIRRDPNGMVEANADRQIVDYYIHLDNGNITYAGLVLKNDLLEMRTVDGRIIGFTFETNKTADTNDLLSHLKDNYGSGKLIYRDGQNDKIYMWRSSNIIAHINIAENSPGKKEKPNVGAILSVINEQALKKGLWPYFHGYLEKIKSPAINK